MRISKLLFLVCIISFVSSCLFAEESTTKKEELSGNRWTGYVIPFVSGKNPAAMKAEIDKKDYLYGAGEKTPEPRVDDNKEGLASGGIKEVAYDENGRITDLILGDGTIVTYEYGAEGELTITSEKDGVILKFQEGSQKREISGNIMTVNEVREQYNKNGEREIIVTVYAAPASAAGKPGTGTADRQPKPALQVICPNSPIPVAELAKTPMAFDFKEIKKAIEKTSKMRARALKEYNHNTSDYYNAVESAIKDNAVALKKEGIDLGGLEGSVVPAANKQNAVEKAVENIYAYAGNGGADKSVKDIISLEKGLRDRIIGPGKEAYERRIERAVEHTDEMVEKLINSQLALYLNIKKDKIDVIINLQKTPKSN